MKKYIIDCNEIENEEAFWDEYVACVKIDGLEYFGRNLDALSDALHAGGPGAPNDKACIILVQKTELLKKIRGGNFYDHLRQIAYDLSVDPGNNIKLKIN